MESEKGILKGWEKDLTKEKGWEKGIYSNPTKTTSYLQFKTRNLEFIWACLEEKYCIILRIAYGFPLMTLPSLNYIILGCSQLFFDNWNSLPLLTPRTYDVLFILSSASSLIIYIILSRYVLLALSKNYSF